MQHSSILLIEDHRDFREAVRHFLELSHVRVRFLEASSGEEGVMIARRKKPDIVVTDFSLGGINGLEAAILIKECVPRSNIVMLSIYDPKEILRRDRRGVIRYFVNKGDLYQKLVPAINKILNDPKLKRSNNKHACLPV